jgi:hypothetical protein
VLVLGLLVAGCGGASKSEPPAGDAKPFADSFMHRLVEVGTWQAIEADVSPQLTPQIRSFQAKIRRDGIDTVTKPGVLRHDCPPSPSVGAGKDCFSYVVSGRQVVPLGGVQKLKARLRLWVEPSGESWQVVNYDYQLLPPS